MKIGDLAKAGTVNIQTLRYYERIGILKPTARKDSGYRAYDNDSLKRLLFIKRSQELGFTLSEIKELLTFRGMDRKSRERTRAKAKIKVIEIKEKIHHLKDLQNALELLIEDCKNGEQIAPCPIIERLEGR